MKIKLACNLNLASRHGAVMGAVFDVVCIERRNSRREAEDVYHFRASSGELCAARYADVLIVQASPAPKIIEAARAGRKARA